MLSCSALWFLPAEAIQLRHTPLAVNIQGPCLHGNTSPLAGATTKGCSTSLMTFKSRLDDVKRPEQESSGWRSCSACRTACDKAIDPPWLAAGNMQRNRCALSCVSAGVRLVNVEVCPSGSAHSCSAGVFSTVSYTQLRKIK